MMRPIGDRSRLTVQATWARTFPPPPGTDLPSLVHLRRDDFAVVEKLEALVNSVRYLIVCGYAVAYHGYVRATGDLDIFVDGTPDNCLSTGYGGNAGDYLERKAGPYY